MDENERLASQGLRVMATARKDFDPDGFDPSADLLPLLDGLTMLALVGIVDPPRPTAKSAIETAHAAGIRVRMITGDHAVTAAAIAKELGIPGKRDHRRRVPGHVRRRARHRDRRDRRDRARTPEDKVRLVESLKREGPDRRDDRRRGERRPGLEERRHRDRDGHHRHRGLERGGDDDPHRRQLRDDREGR